MAEFVNQRIEGMINELEQMRRTNLYNDDEIKEISRKRKEFEYRIQRRLKEKEDYVQYIAYELSLLEDISLRRKQENLTEQKKDIEYAITKRVNKVFKQFIYRFQNDIAIYFEYLKFCRSVGFDHAVSGILGQMLQVHGDKPKTWQLASNWERKEQNNLENARNFLLKGIHRHPESEILYLDLFDIELMIAFQTEDAEEKEKFLKRADVIWKNGMENIKDVTYLFNVCDLSMKYEFAESITNSIKKNIWEKRTEKEVWSYIATKELEGCHWDEIEEYVNDKLEYPKEINYYMSVYEEALQKFPEIKLCTKYIHGLLGLNVQQCTESQKISAVKHAWYNGHQNGLLSNDMYSFGISMLKLEDELSTEEYTEILDAAVAKCPSYISLWIENQWLNKSDEKKLLSILKEKSTKHVKPEDIMALWLYVLDNVEEGVVVQECYSQLENCECAVLLSLKPKFLQKMYDLNGVAAARKLYQEFISTPPSPAEVHTVMIDIELAQPKAAVKKIRKCYEALVNLHGNSNIQVWLDFIKFEERSGNVQAVGSIYRRAIGMLEKNLVDDFIKAQTLAKLN